jgi:soluble lytic murein transglycosylase-like protein
LPAETAPPLMPPMTGFAASPRLEEPETFVLAEAWRSHAVPSPPPAPSAAGPDDRIAAYSPAVLTADDSPELLPRAGRPLLEVDAARGAPRSPYGDLIYDVAVRHSLNPHLIAAVIHVESAFNPRAVSRKGACGLMQLLPATARRFGLRKRKDLFNPEKNVEAGVRYLKWLTRRFSGDVHKILAAYNAGEGAVERYGGIPPYRETQRYVRKVFGLLNFDADPPGMPLPTAVGGGGVVAAGM